MSPITRLSNVHVHNSNSQCCWNRYPVRLLYHEARQAKLAFVGSSNHVFPPSHDRADGQPPDVFQRHLRWTKEEIDALPPDPDLPVYLGCELDILDDTGRHFLLPEYVDLVDYWIAGMHSYFNKHVLALAYEDPDRDGFLADYFEEWGTWATTYITKSRPDVFVHIFWQELECGLFHEAAMDEAACRIFDAAAAAGTAIECSSLQMRVRRPQPPFWTRDDPRGDHDAYFRRYYLHLFELAREAGCTVAFGSDAHVPTEIKDVRRIKRLLEEAGFAERDVFEPTKQA